MELNKQQQLDLFYRYAHVLFERMVGEIEANEELITAIARERLEQGFELYGCLMWTWILEELRRNRFEEYADGLNYMLPEVGE